MLYQGRWLLLESVLSSSFWSLTAGWCGVLHSLAWLVQRPWTVFSVVVRSAACSWQSSCITVTSEKNWCPHTRICSMYATCYQKPKCSLKGTSWRTPKSFSSHFYFQECKSISPKNVVLWPFFPNLNWMSCLHLAVVQFMCQSHREESFYKYIFCGKSVNRPIWFHSISCLRQCGGGLLVVAFFSVSACLLAYIALFSHDTVY